jgi:hypothetical protein
LRALQAASLIALLCAGCAEYPGSGLTALLRTDRGEYRTEALPTAEDGPEVVDLTLTTNAAFPGEQDKPFSGALAPESTVVALGLAGDAGYWLLPAAAPNIESPEYPSFGVSLSFSPDIPVGDHHLFARAGDSQGRFGPEVTAPLKITAPPPPEGALVVSLSWDTEADLDLHVLDPQGIEIWKRNINSYEPPPPGEPVDPAAWKSGALLDFDSNAACVIDGRRRENVIWKEAPPPGKYIVRVDTFSLCAEESARWTAEATLGAAPAGRAQGTSTNTSTQAPHDRGAGVLALTFEVPE